MVEGEQTEHYQEKYITDNSENVSPSSLQFRLSPDKTVMEIEKELRGGYHQYVIDNKGQETLEFKKIGEPLLNDYGIQAVMRRIRSIINSSTVQGNLSEQDFKKFMKNFHIQLARDLMINYYKYEMNLGDYSNIIQSITGFVYLFLSRTINDGERETMKNISKEMYRDGDYSSGSKKGLFGFKT